MPLKTSVNRGLGEHGIIYQEKTGDKRYIIRLYDPIYRSSSFPEGWRLTNLMRDNEYLYLDGVKYEIEKIGDEDKQTIPNNQLEPPKDFYKEIGWSWGAGIRLDLNFFVFRVDFGVKLYDPGRIGLDNKCWRTATNGLNWKDDCAVHFAIGYPF